MKKNAFKLISKSPLTKIEENKFKRMIYSFDGSMTKMIESLLGKNVGEVEKKIVQMKIQWQIHQLESLSQVFKIIHIQFQDHCTYNLTKSWNVEIYNSLISNNNKHPIGLTLLTNKVSTYRQIKWIGQGDIRYNNQILKNIVCRSYELNVHRSIQAAYIQEYFLNIFFNDLFY